MSINALQAISIRSMAPPAVLLFLLSLMMLNGCTTGETLGFDDVQAEDDRVHVVAGTEAWVDVLGNDTGVNASIVSISQPANGTATIFPNQTGGINYQPDASFTGTDTFTYTIEAGTNRHTDTATVTVFVVDAYTTLLAVDDSAQAGQGLPVLIDVLANDYDVLGLGLNIVAVTQPEHGTATIDNNRILFQPSASLAVTAYFTYTIRDDNGFTDTARVVVYVRANTAPVAVDDSAATGEGVEKTIDVVANDSDADEDSLSIIAVSQPTNGSVTIQSASTVSYTPNASFTGTDTFTYTVSDGFGGEATATVSFTVRTNTPPLAVDDSASTGVDVHINIDVLANDSDADADILTITALTQPANGSVHVITTGEVRYIPDSGFIGTNTFAYFVDDGYGGTDNAIVTVSVGNTPPVAVDDSATAVTAIPYHINVVFNDTDADGHSLDIASVTQPANGEVTIDSPSVVIYTSSPGFTGTDTFGYTVSDGYGGTDTGTVTVTVRATNSAPVALDDSASTTTSTLVLIDVLANDSDADGDSMYSTVVGAPANGTAYVSSYNQIAYIPNPGFAGTDTFTYTASDYYGGTDTATVTVKVLQAVIRVSVDSSGNQATGSGYFLTGSPVISDDGWYVAFRSAASDLVTGDTNGQEDVFLHDLYTGTTTLLSIGHDGFPANGGSRDLAMSADGRYVAFRSAATNLVTPDENGVIVDIFLRDTQSGTNTLISLDSSGGGSNGTSYYPDISADGTKIVFYSAASDLVSGDGNGVLDVFLHDTGSGTTTRISMGHDGSEADGNSIYPVISADGKFVAFESDATNLVTGDTNGKTDIFLYETATGITTRVSVDSSGNQGTNPSRKPTISADGQFVAFESSANNLVSGDTNVAYDIFVRDTVGDTTTRVSVASDGTQSTDYENSNSPAISDDGRYVTFYSNATNLVTGDSNMVSDIFRHDRQTGDTTLVSVDAAGTQANGASVFPEISADGRYVVYYSAAGNLVSGDTNGVDDAFRVDVTALP